MMGPVEEAVRETSFPAILWRGRRHADFRKILGHSVNHGVLGIPDTWSSAESAYNTSKASSKEMLVSLLGITALNYLGHSTCVRRASAGANKERKYAEMLELARLKDLIECQDRNRLHISTRNVVCLSAIYHHHSVT